MRAMSSRRRQLGHRDDPRVETLIKEVSDLRAKNTDLQDKITKLSNHIHAESKSNPAEFTITAPAPIPVDKGRELRCSVCDVTFYSGLASPYASERNVPSQVPKYKPFSASIDRSRWTYLCCSNKCREAFEAAYLSARGNVAQYVPASRRLSDTPPSSTIPADVMAKIRKGGP